MCRLLIRARPGVCVNREPAKPYHNALAILRNTNRTWSQKASSNSLLACKGSSFRVAAISFNTKGWQRIAPCPKIIILRVRILAPSTVMPMGIC